MSDEYRLPPPGPYDRTVVTEAELEARRMGDKARINRAIAERQREDAEHAEKLERDRIERGRAALADYEGRAHQRHLHAGGTEADWPAVWRELKTKYLAERAGTDEVERHAAILKASGQFTRM